jgi:hypothetical protein
MLLHLGSFTLVGTQSTCRLLSFAQCGGGLGCSMRFDWLPTWNLHVGWCGCWPIL